MNILILTAKFGLGHYKAADSIKEKLEMESENNNVIVIDFFKYVFPDLYKTIYNTFNTLVYKCPSVYNFLNMLSPKNNFAPFKKVALNKMKELIEIYNIDEIISVVPICSSYVSEYINETGDNISFSTLITDIEVHNSWINNHTSRYFVPSLETKRYLITKNIDKNRIIVSGIPVNSNFSVSLEKNKKKRVLIMGGGLGLIPNIDDFLCFFDSNKNIDTTIILGNNEKLYYKLSKKFKNINVIGYTDKVYDYMKNADLLITKSGGITLFEAIQTETPLFILKPFLIQEIGNAKYIENNNIGKVIWKSDKDIYDDVLVLLNDDRELNIMRENMRSLRGEFSDFKFCSYFSKVGEVC